MIKTDGSGEDLLQPADSCNPRQSLDGALSIEAHLLARYGSLEECRRLAAVRNAKARAAAAERMLGPPAGWPVVGDLQGAGRWAAIDTESTGLDPAGGCRCIEIAVVLVEGGRVILEWASRINPGPDATWEDGAMACNGISPSDVINAATPAEAWAKFVEITAGLPLAAHHADFDRKFIVAELAFAGLEANNTWHCTMGPYRRQLGSLYYEYARRRIDGAHTALGDARAVAYLAPRVCRR